MKKLLLGLFLTTTFSTAMASQHHCGGGYNYHNATKALENFMKTKLSVSPEDITHKEVLDKKGFISRKEAALLALISPIIVVGIAVDDQATYKGFASELKHCTNNTKYKYRVEFHQYNKLCTVNLQVKIKTDVFDPSGYGHTSIVKQKYRPVCN